MLGETALDEVAPNVRGEQFVVRTNDRIYNNGEIGCGVREALTSRVKLKQPGDVANEFVLFQMLHKTGMF